MSRPKFFLIAFYFLSDCDYLQFKANILYVDDDEDSLELLQYYFTDKGYRISTAQNSAEALKKAGKDKFDLFMLDVRLPDGNGGDLALTLRGMQPFTPRLLPATAEAD